MEIRIFIVHYVHCLFDKNSENSHFSTFTHLAGSGRNHDISSEMSALVYLRLPETMVHYKSAFHGDFHIFEKNRFFQVQKLAKKMKIANFTENSC